MCFTVGKPVGDSLRNAGPAFSQSRFHGVELLDLSHKPAGCSRRLLRDVLTRLPIMTNHQVNQLTPAQWNKPAKTVQQQIAS